MVTSTVLSKSFETEDPYQPVLAIRTIRDEQAQKHLFLAQKNASLKSGARGLQARKDLRAAEDKAQASKDMYVVCHSLNGRSRTDFSFFFFFFFFFFLD